MRSMTRSSSYQAVAEVEAIFGAFIWALHHYLRQEIHALRIKRKWAETLFET